MEGVISQLRTHLPGKQASFGGGDVEMEDLSSESPSGGMCLATGRRVLRWLKEEGACGGREHLPCSSHFL